VGIRICTYCVLGMYMHACAYIVTCLLLLLLLLLLPPLIHLPLTCDMAGMVGGNKSSAARQTPPPAMPFALIAHYDVRLACWPLT
jgi:hypothetical protein